jgi:hypothetical protein
MSNKPKSLTVRFAQERETKNAIRFMEVDAAGKPVDADTAHVGTLYVKKRAFEGANPQTLDVTITY